MSISQREKRCDLFHIHNVYAHTQKNHNTTLIYREQALSVQSLSELSIRRLSHLVERNRPAREGAHNMFTLQASHQRRKSESSSQKSTLPRHHPNGYIVPVLLATKCVICCTHRLFPGTDVVMQSLSLKDRNITQKFS